jgi:hypothetical protein
MNKEDYIALTTYESFLENITVSDRETILVGLYHASYGDILTYNLKCPNKKCDHRYETKISISDGFSIDWYEPNIAGKNLLSEYGKIEYKMPSSKSILFAIAPITLKKEMDIYQLYNSEPDVLKLMIMRLKYIRFDLEGNDIFTVNQIIRKVNKMEKEMDAKITSCEDPDEKTKLINEKDVIGKKLYAQIDATQYIDKIPDLYMACNELYSQDKNDINKKFSNDIDIYAPQLKYASVCPKCGHKFDLDVNFTNELFRMVFQS